MCERQLALWMDVEMHMLMLPNGMLPNKHKDKVDALELHCKVSCDM